MDNHCPNCHSLITNEQPSVTAGLSHSALKNKRSIQCPSCQCLLVDHKTPDTFARKLFLTLSIIIVLNVMTTLAFGSSPIADVMLAIMVAALLIALPLSMFRWLYQMLFQSSPKARYQQISSPD